MSAVVSDFIIIGSGFGGSVCAMRLAEKGYSVVLIESGRNWEDSDFPKSNWNFRKAFWAPKLRAFGPQRLSFIKNGVLVLHGSGVGGGSLVYGNTLMRPSDDVWMKQQWPQGTHWLEELKPHFATAENYLGVTTNPTFSPSDLALKGVARRLGVESTFVPTRVGVYFGNPGESSIDPYFEGKGPERKGCVLCGGCLIGCRHNAKNSLPKNYLYFARKFGARIIAETTATRIIPSSDGYTVETFITTSLFKKQGPIFKARAVIVSAGVLGTVDLLLRNKHLYNTLSKISDRLGKNVCTNGESLLGATSFLKNCDFDKGVAIGAAIHPDKHTKIEAVRYPSGSNALRLLATPLTGLGSAFTRPLKMLWRCVLRLPFLIRTWCVRDWARHSVILLVMQSIDRHMHLGLKRSLFGGWRLSGQGPKLPAYIEIAQRAAEELSKEIEGEAQNIFSEVVMNTTATAHILGGCCFAASSLEGVVNSNHEVFGYSNLYVCDASVIPCNLAVNPSLTITALAECFSSKFPSKT